LGLELVAVFFLWVLLLLKQSIMSEKKISSLERIGYQKTLPENADINNYDSLIIKRKNGEKITLYKLSSQRIEFDNTSNFSNSWDVFNSYLN
jgi:hypothetical protein